MTNSECPATMNINARPRMDSALFLACERAAYVALTGAGARDIAAVCTRCGTTFIPADVDDLVHIDENGQDCGVGYVTGGV